MAELLDDPNRPATLGELLVLQDAIGHALRLEEQELLAEPDDPEEQHFAFAAASRERRPTGGRRR